MRIDEPVLYPRSGGGGSGAGIGETEQFNISSPLSPSEPSRATEDRLVMFRSTRALEFPFARSQALAPPPMWVGGDPRGVLSGMTVDSAEATIALAEHQIPRQLRRQLRWITGRAFGVVFTVDDTVC
jgi:hypothetical protein